MIRWLTGLLGAEAERGLLDILPGIGAAAGVALFAAVSLGFGTFAAYVYLRASQERVVAALIICGAYGLAAITIGVIGLALQRLREFLIDGACGLFQQYRPEAAIQRVRSEYLDRLEC
jgi:hypothetical protein